MSIFFDPIFLIKTIGPPGIFAIVFIESGMFFGFFFPGDSLLFTAGLLAATGFFSPFYLAAGCASAAFLGGMFGYSFGKQIGPAIFSREDSIFFHKKHISDTRNFFQKYGVKTIFLARFLPVVRTFVPILAGVGSMRYGVFIIYNFLGSVVWSLLLVGGGFYLGKTIPDIERYILPIIFLIILISFLPTFFEIYRDKRRKKG